MVFLPLILIYIIILPYCWYHSYVSSNEGLGWGWPHAEGRGLFRACWLTENGWTLADLRPNKSWGAEMNWDREKHWVSPKEPRSKLFNCQQDCEDQKYATEMGEGLTNRLGHKSLKVNPRVGPGFQKADKALPGAEILSQHPPFPFLPISPHCCWRGNRSEVKGFSNEWSGSYYLFPPNPRDIVAEPECPGAVVDCQGSQGPWRGPRSSCQGSSSLWWQRSPLSEAAVTEPEALQYNTHLYSMHILLVLVIFHSDKELFPVLCGYFVCSIGLLLKLLF